MSRHTNKLHKLYINSLFINGYTRNLAQLKVNIDAYNLNDINEIICDFYGVKSLQNAVRIQDNKICQYILENNLCGKLKYKKNLFNAVQIGNIEFIKLMLKHYDKFNKIEIHFAKRSYKSVNIIYALPPEIDKLNPISYCIDKLMNDVYNEKYIKITTLLLHNEIDSDILSSKYNASLYHYGCKKNDFEFVKTLIDNYNVNIWLAIKYDNFNYTAIDYANDNNDKIIKKYLEKHIEKAEKLLRRQENQENIDYPVSDGFGWIAWSLISLCCFLPWIIISIIECSIFLNQWNNVININVDILWISIILILFCIIIFILLLIIFLSKFGKNNLRWMVVITVTAMITKQLLSISLLVASLSLNQYNTTTLSLNITDLCFCVMFCLLLTYLRS